jgi:hypothetical protein
MTILGIRCAVATQLKVARRSSSSADKSFSITRRCSTALAQIMPAMVAMRLIRSLVSFPNSVQRFSRLLLYYESSSTNLFLLPCVVVPERVPEKPKDEVCEANILPPRTKKEISRSTARHSAHDTRGSRRVQAMFALDAADKDSFI